MFNEKILRLCYFSFLILLLLCSASASASPSTMAKIPTMFSLWNLLVLSLALNVSLILRMVYESEEGYKGSSSCLKKQRGSSMVDSDSYKNLSIPSSSSSSNLSDNSTCATHPERREKVINLDQ